MLTLFLIPVQLSINKNAHDGQHNIIIIPVNFCCGFVWGLLGFGFFFFLETLRLLKKRRSIENGMKVFSLIQLNVMWLLGKPV